MNFDIHTQDEDSWLVGYVKTIIADALPKLPPREQRFGNSVVRWWDGKPGDVVIMAEGGTIDDRSFAEQLCKTQLEGHGFKRAAFVFESEELVKTSAWPDIMAKAKRLVQSGNVTMLRNGVNNIVAHVVGDHGEYNVEIGRDDPNSQAITTWTCECPWDQYAWGRTRQWKKYEGRPCAHVLAAYWKSKSTPLDDYNPDQHGPMPGQRLQPGMPGRPTAPLQGLPPQAPEPPTGVPIPSPPGSPRSPQIPGPPGMGLGSPDAVGGPPNPLQQPLTPPGPPGILPPSPMEQLQMQQPPAPGQTPGGMPSPPGSVSIPGAKLPSPFNPIQSPGGTYSKVASLDEQTLAQIAQIRDKARSELRASLGEGYNGLGGCHLIAPEVAPLVGGHRESGWFDLHQPETDTAVDHHWITLKDGTIIDPTADSFGWEPTTVIPPGDPRQAKYVPYGQIGADEDEDWYAYGDDPPYSRVFPRTAAQEFYPQQAVLLKNNVWGQTEGKSEQHGAGQYVEVQARKADGSPQHAEVLGQDPTTGWVEIIVSNDEGGPLQPFLTRCFVEPNDIVPTRNSDPGFIRRH